MLADAVCEIGARPAAALSARISGRTASLERGWLAYKGRPAGPQKPPAPPPKQPPPGGPKRKEPQPAEPKEDGS